MALAYSLRCGISIFSQIISNNSRKYCVGVRSLGKKRSKISKTQDEDELVDLPVETNPELLAQYVCGSKLTTEEENITIKSDSEYPDWLWSLHTGEPLQLKDMDPNTLEYWKKVRKLDTENLKYLKSLHRYYRDYK